MTALAEEPSRMSSMSTAQFTTSYTDRDVILYALSIGFGSSEGSYEQDLKYLFEKHECFSVFPTFCLALIFWADQQLTRITSRQSLPIFPPPMMATTGVLPSVFLKGDISVDDYPVLHTFQSITWQNELCSPTHGKVCDANLKSRIVSVAPKSIGTFVSTETSVAQEGVQVCKMLSTALVLGISHEGVRAYNAPPSGTSHEKPIFVSKNAPTQLYKRCVSIDTNTALLYRLGSGDSNHIHVDPHALPMVARSDQSKPRPLLHGLCTLGIAARLIVQLDRGASFRHIQAEFSKPVLIGDCLTFYIWKGDEASGINFEVKNETSGDMVIQKGRAQICPTQIIVHKSRL